MLSGKPVSLRGRVLSKAAFLALLLAVLIGVLAFPVWMAGRDAKALMTEDGFTGRPEVLWQGVVPFWEQETWMLVLRGGDKVYSGRVEVYDNRAGVNAFRGELDDGVTVTYIRDEAYLSGNGRILAQVMALNLPEGADSGELSVTLTPEDVRTVRGTRRDGGIMFPIPRDNDLSMAYQDQGRYDYDLLEEAPYTLTLWDENGTVIAETSGTLGSIWGR